MPINIKETRNIDGVIDKDFYSMNTQISIQFIDLMSNFSFWQSGPFLCQIAVSFAAAKKILPVFLCHFSI